MGWFSLGSERNLSARRRWGFSRRLVSLKELTKPPSREKVVSPWRVVSLRGDYRQGRWCPRGLDAALHGEENGGFPGNVGVVFPVRGGGQGLRSDLFSWAKCCNHEEVEVLGKIDEARLKKKNGVRASSPRARLWGHWAGWSIGFG